VTSALTESVKSRNSAGAFIVLIEHAPVVHVRIHLTPNVFGCLKTGITRDSRYGMFGTHTAHVPPSWGRLYGLTRR
jgi:hypothetical protein